VRELYERKLERTNNLYLELSAVLLQVEQRENELARLGSIACRLSSPSPYGHIDEFVRNLPGKAKDFLAMILSLCSIKIKIKNKKAQADVMGVKSYTLFLLIVSKT
jgi:hypothetical protein